MARYVANIEKRTLDNTNFREVLFTGPHVQLVLMTLKPGEEIGLEAHDDVDQFREAVSANVVDTRGSSQVETR